MNNIFHIADYMAGGVTASDAIEKCMRDAAKAQGGRTIIFNGGEYRLDRAIVLPDDTEIILDGCVLKQNDGVFDNVFRGANIIVNPSDPFGAPLKVETLKNIRIIGKNGAKIIGPDAPRVGYHPVLKVEQAMVGDFWGWRAHTFTFARAENIEIRGLSLSQTTNWAISFDACHDVLVCDMDICSNVKNGDGVDFRSGCHHCRVENITGSTSDDTVACTALSRDTKPEYPVKNYLYPNEPYNCLGTNPDRDIHDITIKNIFTGGLCHGVICLAAHGNKVYNINIENIREPAVGGREASVKIYTGYGDGYNAGDIHDITVKNVVSETSDYAVWVKADVENVTLENIVQNNKNGKLVSGIEY